MDSNHSQATQTVAPPAADDLKLISGIGPAIERRLHGAGVGTYAQLAALSPAEIVALVGDLAGLSAERIVQQDWIGQARDLSQEPDPPAPGEVTPAADRQHYATFTVELLLDEENNVRRTRLVHIQAGDEESWAGWDEARMGEFVAQRAALPISTVEPIPEDASRADPDGATPLETAEAEAAPVAGLSGALRVQGLETLPVGSDGPRSILRSGEAYDVRLTFDLTEATTPSEGSFDYAADVYTRSLGGGPRQVVSTAQGSIIAGGSFTITMEGQPLPPGIYRLEVVASCSLLPARPGLTAHLEGGLLQIY